MARGKPLTREALATVGSDVLAEVLIAHADTDPVLRKKLGMLLAGTEGPDRLAAEIDKRIRTIGRSRSFVSWEQRKPLLHELDHLRQTIVTGLAGQDRERAIELLWNLIGIAAAVTNRMIGANRPAEALTWLDAPRRRFEDEDDTGTGVDLRIAALEALGRKDDAQAVRWRHFERALSAEHLRAYLRRLPDFEDFEAEQRALDVAASHSQAALAIGFFIEWRALDRAERLVRDRLAALDGRLYEVLRPAAEALEEKFPAAASLLYRRMVESVLDRGASKQYPYAARDFASCARLAPRLPASETIESHDTFVARLRKVHGRKYGFWGQFDRKG